jgi:putative flippase GtrA
MHVKRLTGALAAVAATCCGVGLLVSGAANGQLYGSSGISVTPAAPTPGEKITVAADGFKPGKPVTFVFSYEVCRHASCTRVDLRAAGHVTANANGVATDHPMIPLSMQGKSHVMLQAKGHNDVGKVVVRSIPLNLK